MRRQHVAPGRIADPLHRRGGLDDVREQDGREDPLARPVRWDAERPGTRPFDGHPRFVADDPGVVPRRDLVDRLRVDVQVLPVVRHDVHEPGDRVPEVVQLAGRGAGDIRHVRGPSPTGFIGRTTHQRLIERHHLAAAVRERSKIVGRREGARSEAGHRGHSGPCCRSGHDKLRRSAHLSWG